MGDRANILIKSVSGGKVCLYTHNFGYSLPETLKSAMIRGKNRWTDEQYLARIIFCEMIQSDVLGETGFGISHHIGDGKGGHPPPPQR
jgi:hypothetical protein